MPRYFFNVYDGVSAIDHDGTEFENLAAAKLEALQLIGEILRHHSKSIANGEDWHLEVVDKHALILFRVDLLVTDAPVARSDKPTKR
ncbi:DUF6894 family protein [Methylobacterium trifolii]|uniref:DUF6894 family protein n=1 Tax=Methylobacterium trifolii TaxID=1003092 RepID=UPI001EDFA458|nr:hypothetical protein [Methylobacterium trifolii]